MGRCLKRERGMGTIRAGEKPVVVPASKGVISDCQRPVPLEKLGTLRDGIHSHTAPPNKGEPQC